METNPTPRDDSRSHSRRGSRSRHPLAPLEAELNSAGGVHPIHLASDTIPPSAPITNKLSLDDLSFEAFGDRVLIREDEFKSGYECGPCAGTGEIVCPDCAGVGAHGVKKCSQCSGSKRVICPDCGGRGGVLIVPETSQRRPTTGEIVSVGPEVKNLKVGQSVLYSSYAGHTIDLDRAGHKIVLRIVHEPEVLCLVEGHLKLKHVRGKSEIATFQN